MCGRYELNATALELTNRFGDLLASPESLESIPTSYNIAPSTPQPVILQQD
ncbi:MAG: SOS response-associated peptidase family protein [Gammaproteobacteria bacterium]